MSDDRSVVVIGGGVIGVACAHYLNLQGRQVTVIDKGRIGGGSSLGNCGYVSPSHVLPLAEPGAVLASIRMMMKPNSPLWITPGFDPHRWKWLWNFARRCNHRDCLQAGNAIHPLLTSSMQLYEQLIAEHDLQCQWTKQGLLFVYKNAKAMRAYEPTDNLLRREFNEPAQCLTPDELLEFEPALKKGLAGAWYFEHDAHLRPEQLIASWRSLLQRRGVRFIENESLQKIESTAGVARSISTDSQQFAADLFVVATGATTPMLQKLLNFRAPIQPGKGYSITMPRPEVCPNVPMILPERRVAVTPWQSELRLGSMMEFVGYDSSIRQKRLKLLTDTAHEYLRMQLPEQLSGQWFGWRPMTYDSLPIIGKCPSFANVYLAAGHNMLGLSMAPATGRLISEMITDAPTHLPAEPYSPERF